MNATTLLAEAVPQAVPRDSRSKQQGLLGILGELGISPFTEEFIEQHKKRKLRKHNLKWGLWNWFWRSDGSGFIGVIAVVIAASVAAVMMAVVAAALCGSFGYVGGFTEGLRAALKLIGHFIAYSLGVVISAYVFFVLLAFIIRYVKIVEAEWVNLRSLDFMVYENTGRMPPRLHWLVGDIRKKVPGTASFEVCELQVNSRPADPILTVVFGNERYPIAIWEGDKVRLNTPMP